MRLLTLLLLLVSAGCDTNPSAEHSEEAFVPVAVGKIDTPELQKIGRPWGRDTAAETKTFFDSYDHILLVTIKQYSWELNKPLNKSLSHYKGKIAKIYKGGWRVGDEIDFTTQHDSLTLPENARSLKGKQFFVLTKSAKTTKEIPLDTGDFLPFYPENESALFHFYPR